LKEYGEIDSKFRYVILASKRAKQLLKGAKPKLKPKTKNLIRVAQDEVKRGLIEFEIVQNKVEEYSEAGDDMFIGEEIKAVSALADAESADEAVEKEDEPGAAAVAEADSDVDADDVPRDDSEDDAKSESKEEPEDK
jgi:DNA-directed RNA polymerase subunit K/omega